MDTALWTFSLAIYRQPGVAEECLSLQDSFGVDVNVLLLCAYAGSEFGALLSRQDVADADAIVQSWHGDVVKRIRALRQLLKPLGLRKDWAQADAAEALRTRIKAVELESERIEQAMLAQWCAARLAGFARGERAAAIASNIACLLAHYGAGNAQSPLRLIAAALAGKPQA